MTEHDLRRVLTDHVAPVCLPDDARRRIRQAAKEEPQVKKKLSMALVLTLVLVMLSSIALAASMGMFDFLEKRMGTKVLPGTTTVTDIALAETDYATFTICEAAFDGRGASVMVRVTPKDARTFLIGEGGYMLDDPAICITNDPAHEGMTILEYATSQGYEQIVSVNAEFMNVGEMSVVDEWENNELILVFGFEATGDMEILDVEGMTIPFDSEGNLDWNRDQRTAPASFTMQAAAPLWTATVSTVTELTAFGLRIEEVTLAGTTLATYVDIRGTVVDEAAAEQVSIRVADATGVDLRPGATLLSGSSTMQNGYMEANASVIPMESAPDMLYLLVHDYKTGNETLVALPVSQ